jgi:hypothetical protein
VRRPCGQGPPRPEHRDLRRIRPASLYAGGLEITAVAASCPHRRGECDVVVEAAGADPDSHRCAASPGLACATTVTGDLARVNGDDAARRLLAVRACGLGQECQPGQRRGHGVPPPLAVADGLAQVFRGTAASSANSRSADASMRRETDTSPSAIVLPFCCPQYLCVQTARAARNHRAHANCAHHFSAATKRNAASQVTTRMAAAVLGVPVGCCNIQPSRWASAGACSRLASCGRSTRRSGTSASTRRTRPGQARA